MSATDIQRLQEEKAAITKRLQEEKSAITQRLEEATGAEKETLERQYVERLSQLNARLEGVVERKVEKAPKA